MLIMMARLSEPFLTEEISMGKKEAAYKDVGDEETLLFTMVSAIWAGRGADHALKDLRNAVYTWPSHVDEIIKRICEMRTDIELGRIPRYGALAEDTVEDMDRAIATIRRIRKELEPCIENGEQAPMEPIGSQ
jgi:hypothetical protein